MNAIYMTKQIVVGELYRSREILIRVFIIHVQGTLVNHMNINIYPSRYWQVYYTYLGDNGK